MAPPGPRADLARHPRAAARSRRRAATGRDPGRAGGACTRARAAGPHGASGRAASPGQDAPRQRPRGRDCGRSQRGDRARQMTCGLAALTQRDYAAGSSPRRGCSRARLVAGPLARPAGGLDRISSQQRETSPDDGRPSSSALAELGDSADAASPRADLSDFDPAIACRRGISARKVDGPAARRRHSRCRRFPSDGPTSWPIFSHTRRAAPARSRRRRAGGCSRPDAPLNAFRLRPPCRSRPTTTASPSTVWCQASSSQGGSPGANEYSGRRPIHTDEIGVPNRRGFVGLSRVVETRATRQFYVNARGQLSPGRGLHGVCRVVRAWTSSTAFSRASDRRAVVMRP